MKAKENSMSSAGRMLAMLLFVVSVAPFATVNGEGYQFIDNTTYPAVNVSYSASSPAIKLETGTLRTLGSSERLEARSQSQGMSGAITLNAMKFSLFIITFR